MDEKIVRLAPQAGPQTTLLETSADIAIFGGGAGGGKTYGILLDCLRHYNNGKASATYFRRNTTQIRNQGGLWDESQKMFTILNGIPKETTLEWKFPSGFKVKFAHLEYNKTVNDYQGAQIPVIYFDELTHFTEKQFFYMLSRNRSTSGIKSYVRATCNPDSKSWVKQLISWWLDDEGLFARKDRAGKIRWFYRIDGKLIWDDSKEALMKRFPTMKVEPKSLTFIPSMLDDNKIFMKQDPGYKANLMAMDKVEREQLLNGNWGIEATAGEVFKKHDFKEVEAVPRLVEIVRMWDRAATEWNEGDKGDPDYTVGFKLGRCSNGFYYILDIIRERLSAHKVEQLIINTALQDGYAVKIKGFQDPGGAGKGEAENFVRMLAGYDVTTEKISVDKVTAAKAASAQVEAGNVYILNTCRNKEAFYSEAENFPDASHDDTVDGFTGGFNKLAANNIAEWSERLDTDQDINISANMEW